MLDQLNHEIYNLSYYTQHIIGALENVGRIVSYGMAQFV